MTTNVAALYPDRATAERAVDSLVEQGVPLDRISALTHDELSYDDEVTSSEAGEGATAGAVGGLVGGVATSLALAAVPGIGWVLVAGPVASVLASGTLGAAVGAAAGGIAGAINGSGVAEGDADLYSEAVRRGGTVVMLTVVERDVGLVEAILEEHDPVDTELTAERYRAEGWASYDPKAEPLQGDALRAERDQLAREAHREYPPTIGPTAPTLPPRPARVRKYDVDQPVDELSLGAGR